MAGFIKAKEFGVVTLEASGGSTANNAQVASTNTFDNTAAGNAGGASTGDGYTAHFELHGGFGSSPAVGAVINLYLIPTIGSAADYDATNHNMPPACFVGSFVVNKAQTAAQTMVILGVPVGPLAYQPVCDNQAGQTLSSTWTLKAILAEDQYT